MIKQTLKNVAPVFPSVKTEKHMGNDKEVLAFRINEHSARGYIDADAVNAARLAENIKRRNAERRHLSAIIEVA